MSRTTLTKREQDTLVAIQTFMKKNHYPPTIKEIGTLINVTSTSTVSRFLIKLEQKGYISREESKPRSTRILA
ncbi:MarR family transcriptional regulator [Paenibacillus lautus]|uniref:LexA family protein n=1 Tax=Paenibacillus lautus TaxID=1401 RepID=UPI003D2E5D2C